MEITQDVTQALKDTENSLRDFIAVVLRAKLGQSWLENCGVSLDRLGRWKERQEKEKKRQGSGVVEQRLIYYADFYDLRTILKKHWAGEFSAALGDWKTMEVWLSELERMRDPDAHRRELMPHQKYLVLGISGEIRTRLVRYRSKQETSEDYFPRIESVRDSLGNIYTYGDLIMVHTKMVLRVGDKVEFLITAMDPLGEPLQYGIQRPGDKWQDSNVISVKLTDADVGKGFQIVLLIKSNRAYHAVKDYDDLMMFIYDVLPPRQPF